MKAPTKRLYLLYHELVAAPASYTYALSLDRFNGHLAFFRQLLDQQAELQPALTFDDGHESVYEFGLPAMAQFRLQAQLFITAGWIGRRAGYLNWPQLRTLQAAGHTVGAHGWSHALMTSCTAQELKIELVDARRLLEDKLGVAVTTLSFPGGRFNRRVLAACHAAGYTHCFTSIPQVSGTLPATLTGRVNIRNTMDAAFLRSLLAPGSLLLRRMRLEEGAKSGLRRILGDGLYARLWSHLNHEPAAPAADLPAAEQAG